MVEPFKYYIIQISLCQDETNFVSVFRLTCFMCQAQTNSAMY